MKSTSEGLRFKVFFKGLWITGLSKQGYAFLQRGNSSVTLAETKYNVLRLHVVITPYSGVEYPSPRKVHRSNYSGIVKPRRLEVIYSATKLVILSCPVPWPKKVFSFSRGLICQKSVKVYLSGS